jgi:hypothetical protein
MRHSFKVMHDELHTVKARISPAWARGMAEMLRHESWKGLLAGSCWFWTRDLGPARLTTHWRWLASMRSNDGHRAWGQKAEVLQPERLREAVRDDLERTQALYGSGEAGLAKWTSPLAPIPPARCRL